MDSRSWDLYFHSICESIAQKSPCLSRKIGAILVRDKSVVSTGYNGPPREIPHCGHARFMKDSVLAEELYPFIEAVDRSKIAKVCPRKFLGYESGAGMHLCPAQHAEENCVSNAARLGVSTVGTILYMNCIIPCGNCFGTLINAGIKEIVVTDTTRYDNDSKFIIENSSIKIRKFEL